MGSETVLHLPVINFSTQNLKAGKPEWDSVRVEVRKALQEYGCFEALFDTIPVEFKKAILGALKELFDLPLQTKMRSVSEKPYHGYIGQLPEVPLYESLGIYNVDVPGQVDAFTENLWPEGNKTISKTIQSFSEKLLELDVIVRRMIMESFGLDKNMDEHLTSTAYLLRVMKYEGSDTAEMELGLKPHTDKSIVTILYQSQVDGLEVQSRDGRWMKVKPSEDSFIVMIGDSLYALLNGRLQPPYHRGMMEENGPRYSLALFSTPKEGNTINAPEELVDKEHPRLF